MGASVSQEEIDRPPSAISTARSRPGSASLGRSRPNSSRSNNHVNGEDGAAPSSRPSSSASSRPGSSKTSLSSSKGQEKFGGPRCKCISGHSLETVENAKKKLQLGSSVFCIHAEDVKKLLGLNGKDPCEARFCVIGGKGLVDVFQFLATLCLFSYMRDLEKLEFIFNLFDFDGRGSLNYDELFLAFDCSVSGIERYGGEIQVPEIAQLESVLDQIFLSQTREVQETGRLSRYCFVHHSSIRLKRWLMVLALLLAEENRGGGSSNQQGMGIPAEFQEYLISNEIVDTVCTPLRALDAGKIEIVCGGNDAFFMQDGGLVHIGSSVVVFHPTKGGSTVIESTEKEEKPIARWYHSSPITHTCYSWDGDIFVTSCSEKILVWDYRKQTDIIRIPVEHGGCSALAYNHPSNCLTVSFHAGSIVQYQFGIGSSNLRMSFGATVPPKVVKTICFLGDDCSVVVAGEASFVEFFWPESGERRRGNILSTSKRTFFSSARHKKSNLLMLGDDGGALHLWQGTKCVRTIESAHGNEPIYTIHACSRGFVTAGGETGVIHLWSLNAQLVASFGHMKNYDAVLPGIQSVCWSIDGTKLVCTTHSSEIYQLSGINGNNLSKDQRSPFSVGHHDVCLSHIVGDYLLTAGRDLLKLWDFQSGRIISTCMLEYIPTCIGTLLTVNSDKLLCAIGSAGGLVVVERNFKERNWVQVFECYENGYNPCCVAISPCGRFVAAGDRIFDLTTSTLHGNCPAILDSPDNFYFDREQAKNHWRLIVNDECFDLITKGFFRTKAVKPVTTATLEKERKRKARKKRGTVITKDEEVKLEEDPQIMNNAFAGPEPKSIWLDKEKGIVIHLQGETVLESPKVPETILPKMKHGTQLLVKSDQSFRLDKVQGSKGPWNDSIVSSSVEIGYVAYSADDVLVLVDSKAVGSKMMSTYFPLQGEIVSMASTMATEHIWRVAVLDKTNMMSIFDMNSADGTIRVGLRSHFEYMTNAIQVTFTHDPNYVAVVDDTPTNDGEKNAQFYIIHLPSQTLFGYSKLQLSEKTVTGNPSNVCKAPVPRKHSVSFVKEGQARNEFTCVETYFGAVDYCIHRMNGREIQYKRGRHDSGITFADGNWLGDVKGSIFQLNAQNELTPICRNVHDNGPVVALRDRVSVSEAGIVRLWSDDGKLVSSLEGGVDFIPTMSQRQLVVAPRQNDSESTDHTGPPIQVTSVSRFGAIIDGHMVANLSNKQVITCTHKRISSTCTTWNHLGREGKVSGPAYLCTIGDKDASVAIWELENELTLANQALLLTAPKGAICTCSQFSYSNKLLAIGTSKGTVHIVQVPNIQKQIAILDSGDRMKSIACIAWAPDESSVPRKVDKNGEVMNPKPGENQRFAFATSDGMIFFFNHKYKQIKSPLKGLQNLKAAPAMINFASDCELVRCQDIQGNNVYADSVSANHIPETSLDADWKIKEEQENVVIVDSVIKLATNLESRSVHVQNIATARDLIISTRYRPLKKMFVLGVHPNAPKSFNHAGELIYVAGNCVLGYDVDTRLQRLVYHAPHLILDAAFDEAHSDQNLLAIRLELPSSMTDGLCFSQVLVVDTSTSTMVKEWTIVTEEPLKIRQIALTSVQTIAGKKLPHVVMLSECCKMVYLDPFSNMQSHLQLPLSTEYCDMSFLNEESICCVSEGQGTMDLFSIRLGYLQFMNTIHIKDLLKRDEEVVVSCCKGPGILGTENGMVIFVKLMDNFHLVLDGPPIFAHAKPLLAISLLHHFKETGIFASSDQSGDVKIWKARTTCTFVETIEPTRNLSLHPAGTTLATDVREILCECSFENAGNVFPFLGHTMDCLDYCFFRNGQFMFTCGSDFNIFRWEVATRKKVAHVPIEDIPFGIACCKDRLYVLLNAEPTKKLVVLDTIYYDVVFQAKLPSPNITSIYAPKETGTDVILVDDAEKKKFVLRADNFKFSGPFDHAEKHAEPEPFIVELRGQSIIFGER